MADATETNKAGTLSADDRRAAELAAIDDEICEIMRTGNSRWTELYAVIHKVETEELYKPAYKSLTAWARALAQRGGFALRELWRDKKAGEFYSEYAVRQAAKNRHVPELTDIRVGRREGKPSISPHNFEVVRKIAGGDDKTADKLIDGMLAGRLKAKELDEIWKAKRKEGVQIRKSRHEEFKVSRQPSENELKESGGLTAADIVMALQMDHSWLPEEPKKRPYVYDKYKVFTEVPMPSGTTDHPARVDALACETYGVDHLNAVFLHAIEIKVSLHDLQDDIKMSEYAEFADSMWIAVPDTPIMVQAAQAKADEMQGSEQLYGVLAIATKTSEENGADRADSPVRVVRKASIRTGVMIEDTLRYLVHRYAL